MTCALLARNTPIDICILSIHSPIFPTPVSEYHEVRSGFLCFSSRQINANRTVIDLIGRGSLFQVEFIVRRRRSTWFDLPRAHRITSKLIQSALRLESNTVPTLAVQRTGWSSQWRNLPLRANRQRRAMVEPSWCASALLVLVSLCSAIHFGLFARTCFL